MSKLESFSVPHQDGELETHYIETMRVTDGVTCDVYTHPETHERDLGIITIAAGKSTPRQKVLSGEETIEGYISGKGKLIIRHTDGTESSFQVDPNAEGFCHLIEVGDVMQWHADEAEELKVFEICFPPYSEGRFEDIVEQ